MSFLEGAVGLGTELDAVFRSFEEGGSFAESLAETQKRQKAFREDNEALATATEWGGIAAGFLVPGGVLAKSGQAISKGAQVALAAGGVPLWVPLTSSVRKTWSRRAWIPHGCGPRWRHRWVGRQYLVKNAARSPRWKTSSQRTRTWFTHLGRRRRVG